MDEGVLLVKTAGSKKRKHRESTSSDVDSEAPFPSRWKRLQRLVDTEGPQVIDLEKLFAEDCYIAHKGSLVEATSKLRPTKGVKHADTIFSNERHGAMARSRRAQDQCFLAVEQELMDEFGAALAQHSAPGRLDLTILLRPG